MDKFKQEEKKELLQIARESIEFYFKEGVEKDFQIKDGNLKLPRGVFVTLRKYGHLRGCIGCIDSGGKALWVNVRDMAIAAAFSDWRFEPLGVEELADLEIEISVLSESERLDDWRKIKLGKHGVIISKGNKSGLFLPQVAIETGWNLQEFLEHLCIEKAGLDKDAYRDPDVLIEVFTVESFKTFFT